MGERRGPNLFERTPGKERGCQRDEGDFGSSLRDASAGGDATGASRVWKTSEQCSEATFVANRNREEARHRVWRASRYGGTLAEPVGSPDRPNAGGSRSRARSTPAENVRRARREQAVPMDDRSSGHDPRSGSRCPGDLRSRSHLDSPGARLVEVSLRLAAAASDGGPAGRTSLLRRRKSTGPGSIRARERACSNQSEADAS